MHELYSQARDYLVGIWRRRWVVLAVAWLLALLGWGLVFWMPDQYTATARVHADTQSVLKPLLQGLTVDPDLERRVDLMRRTLLSRPNLEEVARMTDLDLTATTASEEDILINRLQKQIQVIGTSRDTLYTIQYTDKNPKDAKAVVDSLLQIFIEKTLGANRKDTDTAEQFLDQQIKEYKMLLEDAEARLKEFKQKNVGMMPGDNGDFYTRLQAMQSQAENEKLTLRELTNRRDEIRRQIAGEEPGLLFLSAGSGSSDQIPHKNDEQIAIYKTNLSQLMLTYTDKHPDVVRVKEILQQLEGEREKDLAKKREEQANMAPVEQNPLSQNRVYQNLKISLSQTEAELAVVRTRLAEYESRLQNLKKLIDTVPAVEAELTRLNRDYEIYKRNYEKLVERKESAKISRNVEQQADNITFRTIDPPHVDSKPSGPNRPLFSTVVLLASAIAGLAFAFVLSQIRPVFESQRALYKDTGMPVLGTVTLVQNTGDKVGHGFALVSYVSACVGLVACYFGVVSLQYVGINPLWMAKNFLVGAG